MKKPMRRLLVLSVLLFPTYTQAKTFVYCSEAAPKIFNPQLATDGATFNATGHAIYNRLVEFVPGATKVEPALATKWTVSKDGLTYTFNLRPNVKWHTTEYFKPTRDFNADDVVFTWMRMLDKSHPYHAVNGGTYEYFNSMDMSNIIGSVTKKGPLVVEFKLKKQEAPFLANLAMPFASVLSEEYGKQQIAAKKLEDFDHLPVGTGPFVFKRYVKDNQIRYEKNPTYFEGPSKIETLVFAITTDPSVRYQKLRAGECQFISNPAHTDLAAIRKNAALKITEGEGLNIGYLGFNVTKKPFDDVRVRQAIAMALNRQSYIQPIYEGNAVVATNPMPPTIWGFNKNVKAVEYNVEKAKALLKEAGFPNGFAAEMWTLPVSRPYNPNGRKMGELMQADLAKVGIKLTLQTYKWATYLDKASKGEHQLIQVGWNGDNGDPDNFLYTLLSCAAVKGGSNYARWCNQEFDKTVTQAKQTPNIAERTKLYMKAQEIFAKELPWVPLAYAKDFRAMNAKVKGYTLSPFGDDEFFPVDIQ